MRNDIKSAASNRLARIEGQVRGVANMIEDDRYCIDVMRQLQATKAALAGVEQLILDDHLNTCVAHALSGNDLSERREKVEELVAILGGQKK